ncbi:hypothetical protein G4Z16_01395 [Streptomyces bathyalis]|uniref:DUF4352 domain-containing protein n=1 Tax=Streptomyces bathyalis TaxID=2710756 RepID=A0A7T1WS16_9ACTN|nr:hypothetical protein [Streptomyces bathyalis]QPP05260.1 hypothetical protein G4Z16_01395 [Streptomyces bathyalis]
MKIRTVTAVATIAVALPLTAACGASAGHTTGTPAACKKEMQRLFDKAMDDPDAPTPETTPPACRGLSEKQLKKYVGEITEKAIKEGVDDAFDDAVNDMDDSAGDADEANTELKVGDTFTYEDGVNVTVASINEFTAFEEYGDTAEPNQTPFRIDVKFENGSGKPVNLDDFMVNGQGATKGGDAEFTSWTEDVKDITGRLAAGQSDTKNSDGVLDKKYGTKMVVTVTRVSDDVDVMMEVPTWTGSIR